MFDLIFCALVSFIAGFCLCKTLKDNRDIRIDLMERHYRDIIEKQKQFLLEHEKSIIQKEDTINVLNGLIVQLHKGSNS